MDQIVVAAAVRTVLFVQRIEASAAVWTLDAKQAETRIG